MDSHQAFPVRPIGFRPGWRVAVCLIRLAAAAMAAAALLWGARTWITWMRARENLALLEENALEGMPFPGFLNFFFHHGFYLASLVFAMVTVTAAAGLWVFSRGAWRAGLVVCLLAMGSSAWTFFMHGAARVADTGWAWWLFYTGAILTVGGMLLSPPVRRLTGGGRASAGGRVFWGGVIGLALAAVLSIPAVLVAWKIHLARTADEPFWALRRPVTQLTDAGSAALPLGWKPARQYGFTFPAPETGTLMLFPLTEREADFGMTVILVEDARPHSVIILSAFSPAGLPGLYDGTGRRDGIDMLHMAYASNWSLMPMIARQSFGGDGNPAAYYWESRHTKAFARVERSEGGRGRVYLDLYFKESGVHRDMHLSGVPTAETEAGLAALLSSIRWGEEETDDIGKTGLPKQLELLRRYLANDMEAGLDLAEKLRDDGRTPIRQTEQLLETILRNDPRNERARRLRDDIGSE